MTFFLSFFFCWLSGLNIGIYFLLSYYQTGEEIDDTMPGGGADEMPDHSKEVKGNLKKLKVSNR